MSTTEVYLLPLEVLLRSNRIYENEGYYKEIIPYKSYYYDFSINEGMVPKFGAIHKVENFGYGTYVIVDQYAFLKEWFIELTPSAKLLYKD